MDLYQLRYFLEVARELNFTRAAENLRISPPAVSRSVALLETSLRKKLFVRTKRRVELTADGEFLKEKVERLYDDIGRIRLELEGEASQRVSMLKIGSREMITHYLLTQPLLEFKKRRPATRFGIYELDPDLMAEALSKDQIDFGFYYSDIQDPALESRHLGSLRSHVYAARRLFPGGKPPAAFRDLLQYPFIAPRYFRSDPALPSVDGFPDQRHPRNIQYEGEFLETHRRFVLEGIAAAVLPDLVIKEELRKGLVIQFSGPAISREIYFFKRRSRPLPKAVEEFCELILAAIKRVSRES